MSALLLAWLVLSSGALVDERLQIPPCSRGVVPAPSPGRVIRLFELHKDYHPQNVLVVYTYVDARCRVLGSTRNKKQLVDMYWRMSSGSKDECYKPTDPRIKAETLDAFDVKSVSPDRSRFMIDFTQLDQVEHDLPSREIEVVLSRSRSVCGADVRLTLGSSSKGAVLHLREVDARGEYSLGVPRRAIAELALVGVDEEDRPLRRVFRAR